MARPRAEVTPQQWNDHVRGVLRAHQDVTDARDAVREAEDVYAEAVVAAVRSGVVPTALARELGITSQAIRDLMRRRG